MQKDEGNRPAISSFCYSCPVFDSHFGTFLYAIKETSFFCGLDCTMGHAIFEGGPHSVEAHLEHVGRAWSAGEECLAPGGVDDMGCCHVLVSWVDVVSKVGVSSRVII